ncbi:DMT family transporter [Hydromonas duriensis]|uniref:Threonine/homoserine efflux transporter RhtA n=1 Tax=Hydromonas duriensis TaxID=1527608 RepID=A0A4R6Y2L3_9BURK|nr:DMT family transporter [Hydromonas duriensis]TDR30584.1 threonine/homoserine efflux transporter RhtA [Hydromonas duriensis]
MSNNVLLRFTLLAAIWGSSFLFMRILAPVVGGFWTAELRLTIGALTLLILGLLRGHRFDLQYWRHYAMAGLLNCAIPFTLFGLAGQVLPAGYSAVLNASAPLWATVFGVLFMKDTFTPQGLLALLLGVSGVTMVAQPSGNVDFSLAFISGVLACVCATACYALNGIYIKTRSVKLEPHTIATLSQAFGALMLLPFTLSLSPTVGSVTPAVVISAFSLGALCSGVAFLLYYRLLSEIGPLILSGVTFLIPLFGIFWGWLILNERLDWHVFMGCGLIISGALLLYRSHIIIQKAK